MVASVKNLLLNSFLNKLEVAHTTTNRVALTLEERLNLFASEFFFMRSELQIMQAEISALRAVIGVSSSGRSNGRRRTLDQATGVIPSDDACGNKEKRLQG